jgi:hypothetical protein
MNIKFITIRKDRNNKSRVSVVTDKKEYSFTVDIPVDIVRKYRDKIEDYLRCYFEDRNTGISKEDRRVIKEYITNLIKGNNNTTAKEVKKETNVVKQKQDINEEIYNKVVDLLLEMSVNDGLIGARLMAFGDALAFLRNFQMTPPSEKVYIGEGYDYKDDVYVYVIVTPDLDVDIEVEKKK